MASKYFTSLAVAIEATFGSVSASTGIPDEAGLTWSQVEIADRGAITFTGEAPMVEDNGPRTGPWARPGEFATVKTAGGVTIQRRSGTVSVTFPMRSGLTEAGSTSALWKFLLGGLDALHAPAAGVDDVTIAPTTTSSWTATTPAKYTAGALIGVESNGRWDYAPINDEGNPVVTALALAQSPGAAKTLRLLACAATPAEGAPVPDTLALDMRGAGWQEIAFGCRPTRYLIAMEADTRRIMVTVDLDVAYFKAIAAPSAPTQVVPSGGGIDHQIQSYVALGSLHDDDGVPDLLSAEARAVTLCLDELELEVSLTNAFPGCGESILGRGEPEVVDATAELRMTVSSILDAPGSATGVDAQFWARQTRQVLVGLASGAPGSIANGAALWLPSAFLAADPALLDNGGERLRQRLVFRAGPPAKNVDGDLYPSLVIGVGV